MKRLVTYAAVLDDSENKPNEYTVTFPDIPGAITDGQGLSEALNNAEEVLGLMLFDQNPLPAATDIKDIQAQHSNATVSYITTDLDQAKKEVHVPLVKKNTTIPADLAQEAEKHGINFSAALTAALKERLGIKS